MQRREYLARLGVAAAVGTVAGCSALDRLRGRPGPGGVESPDDGGESTDGPAASPPGGTATRTATPVAHADEFGTVLDVVEQGAATDASTSITPLLRQLADDDVLLSFPAGRYLVEPLELEGLSNVGFAAAGDERPLLLPTGRCRGTDPFLRLSGVDDLLVDGFDVDFRPNGAGGPVQFLADGDFTVRNLRLVGSCDPQIAMVRFDVRDPSGVGLVENLSLENPLDRHARLTGAFVGERHAGTITFRDCNIRGFTDNGLYASAPGRASGHDGIVHVENGRYTNNNVSNVRLGTTGATARGVTIEVDTVPPHPLQVNARGIRLRARSGQVIDDCRVVFGPKAGASFGGVVLHPANGGATVRNSHITVDTSGTPAVRALAPERPGGAGLVLENVRIDGMARGGSAVELTGRNGSVLRNSRITQRAPNRGGLTLAELGDCRLVDSHLEVGGAAVTLENARVTVENTTFARVGSTSTAPVRVGDREPVVWDARGGAPVDDGDLPGWLLETV